ncbi:MAG: sugar ABC transporter permease [Chloroflexi bacterium]|nr:sugar ABC transporter permease [Chloroflexota bacterium]
MSMSSADGQARLLARRGPSKLARREAIEGYLFVLPAILGFFIWVAGPMVASVAISLSRWDLFTPPVWVGAANYAKLGPDPLFSKSLVNTAFYTFVGVPLHLIVALLAAMLLNVKVYGISIYRTAFYVPSIVPVVANTLLWLWILQPEFGLANAVIDLVGLPRQTWLHDPVLAKPVFIVMSLWSLGTQMVIFLAGLQGIPETLYEAAAIDGAGRITRFQSVTLPLLSPVVFFNLVIAIIGSFQVFAVAFIATQGGPNDETLFYVLYVFRHGFEFFNMGYAAALAWVLFAIVLVFTLIQFAMSRSWVYYESYLKR